mmetsp:Transcript_933/g.3906  ORF Transcript_933/g.3906 Transcript_933/m.3906 type:complete len:296 (-) Transcript_933:153-1040(-)|eukprot:scaffold1499_cov255-Pinguiococcus_pyrenoidosus.AAC.11
MQLLVGGLDDAEHQLAQSTEEILFPRLLQIVGHRPCCRLQHPDDVSSKGLPPHLPQRNGEGLRRELPDVVATVAKKRPVQRRQQCRQLASSTSLGKEAQDVAQGLKRFGAQLGVVHVDRREDRLAELGEGGQQLLLQVLGHDSCQLQRRGLAGRRRRRKEQQQALQNRISVVQHMRQALHQRPQLVVAPLPQRRDVELPLPIQLHRQSTALPREGALQLCADSACIQGVGTQPSLLAQLLSWRHARLAKLVGLRSKAPPRHLATASKPLLELRRLLEQLFVILVVHGCLGTSRNR